MMTESSPRPPLVPALSDPGSGDADAGVPRAASATQSELFGALDDAGAVGLAIALADVPAGRPWLWVQDRRSAALHGRPYWHGLPRGVRDGLIVVEARRAEDALFAMEEGVRCPEMAVVIGELAGDPRSLDFTASRRLSVACERHGVPLYLVRNDAQPTLSAARMRWRVRPHATPGDAWNPRAAGSVRWQAELFRARGRRPGQWVIGDDGAGLFRIPAADGAGSGAAHPVDLVPGLRDRPLAARGIA